LIIVDKKMTLLVINALIIFALSISGIFQGISSANDFTDRVVTVPILLYHNITNARSADSRYSVSIDNFRDQMKQLRYWGYSTISVEQLVDHIKNGSTLPLRPVVISFDDGYLEVYNNAYPIMEKNGFTGTVYVVANRLNAEGFLQEDELQELLDSGWEVGSHGMTHTELTQNHDLVRQEILQSRLDLEHALGIKVYSFAYPFGSVDWYISSKVYDYGYRAAVGVGNIMVHSFGTVYNFSRREVQGDADLEAFADLLPWSNYFVPAPIRKYIPE
jgi:peptidoglycan/xylan/chitin deacetylase (PgdA/CDA1 family)